MEALNITKNDQVSIGRLVDLQEQGFSVLRSAHIGNLSPYNLSLAAAGIRLLCVDHTITDIDTNYFPESIIRDGASQRIAGGGLLVCRALVDHPAEESPAERQFVDELHIASIREAISTACIFTNSEYLRANESIATEITRLGVRHFPEQFTRLAMPDGTTQKTANAAQMVGRLGIMQLSDDIRSEQMAVIMPNIVDMMASFVIEALASERDTQYHLSGPAMVRYIKGMVPNLQKFYGIVKQSASFGQRLPEHLTVQLVPSSEARFATTIDRRPKLEGLLAAIKTAEIELEELAERRKKFFSGTNRDLAETKIFTGGVKRQQAVVETAIAEKAEAIPELFTEPGTRGFITQFDVLGEGGVFVPAMNRELPMTELSRIFKLLVKIRGRVRL